MQQAVQFYRALFEELEPAKIQRQFLKSLLKLQNVERGSLWMTQGDAYMCVEAMGPQSDKIKGVSIHKDRPSIVGWVIENGQMTIAKGGLDDRHYKELEESLSRKSNLILCFPLTQKGGGVYGAVQIIDTSAEGDHLNLDKDYLKLLHTLVSVASIALANSLEYAVQHEENIRLKRTLEGIRGEVSVIGQSRAFINVMRTAQDYARTDFPVLITGESGTGKEVAAMEIHRLSARRDMPFLVQNCSAIPETLLESELFGYKKGAFTGAVRDKVGLFEAADKGTVFLDEIGDMPFNLQSRILRVLQNLEVKPLGGSEVKKIDVRIIAATNKDLDQAVRDSEFREDLFYRLNVLPVHMPPLRERSTDVPLLLRFFLKRDAQKVGIAPKRINDEAMAALTAYPWPGNIREMENFVKYLLTTTDTELVTPEDLPKHFLDATRPEGSSEDPALARPAHAGGHAPLPGHLPPGYG
ncbi:MAG: hydrogenase, partial [Desulfovibrio sp.]